MKRILFYLLILCLLSGCSQQEYGNKLELIGETTNEKKDLLELEMLSEIYLTLLGTEAYKQKLKSYGIELEVTPKEDVPKVCSECGKESSNLRRGLGGWFCKNCRKARNL